MRVHAPTIDRWLLLIHQLPAKPAYLRVKIWRRLQDIGAVAVKKTVYALPIGEQSQEDFAWLLREIAESGGEAMICEARLIEGLSDQEVRAKFNDARDADYQALAADIRKLPATAARDDATAVGADVKAQVTRFRTRMQQIIAIDFFGADRREGTEGILAALEARVKDGESQAMPAVANAALGELTKRTWVTRAGVQVDRIASAWLIRRFIDPAAGFKFVPAKGYEPRKGELRFDMFQGEFTHEGDRCTFEVLIARCGIRDAALDAIAEIVHDIDLKDGKYGRDETPGIARLLGGIAASIVDDKERITKGSEIFEGLYESFRAQGR
ncbi:chromate resistance protein ChrB domain-containing protein [Ferrovibrio sp. MS7]|uniref:chromate resistance protein ChrB domain-containing protein n=1 Tax=Ferrovibrio plantarum TaxID=3119164 RepID=UPI0031368919